MASFGSNQVRDSSCPRNIRNDTRRGPSKAQASLKKILHVISSVKPPCDLLEPKPLHRGFDIDLNLSVVGPLWEPDESENGDLSACSFVGKENESNLSEVKRIGEKTREGSSSDITNLQETEDSVKENEVAQDGEETRPFKEQNDGKSSNDCLNMLIAAAELISSNEAESSSPSQDKVENKTGTDNNNNNNNNNVAAVAVAAAAAAAAAAMVITESTTSESKKHRETYTAVLEDTSAPVVRSKRGRNQALPYRYRDSVLLLEPSRRRRTKTKRRSR